MLSSRPGMLAAISEALVQAGLSVESITTHLQRPNRKSEDVDFVIEAECVTARYMDKDQLGNLTKELESLKESLELNVVDIRVQRLVSDGPV